MREAISYYKGDDDNFPYTVYIDGTRIIHEYYLPDDIKTDSIWNVIMHEYQCLWNDHDQITDYILKWKNYTQECCK